MGTARSPDPSLRGGRQADEAIQSRPVRTERLDCFDAARLAMTTEATACERAPASGKGRVAASAQIGFATRYCAAAGRAFRPSVTSGPMARSISGMTSPPKRSIERIAASCGMAPMVM